MHIKNTLGKIIRGAKNAPFLATRRTEGLRHNLEEGVLAKVVGSWDQKKDGELWKIWRNELEVL